MLGRVIKIVTHLSKICRCKTVFMKAGKIFPHLVGWTICNKSSLRNLLSPGMPDIAFWVINSHRPEGIILAGFNTTFFKKCRKVYKLIAFFNKLGNCPVHSLKGCLISFHYVQKKNSSILGCLHNVLIAVVGVLILLPVITAAAADKRYINIIIHRLRNAYIRGTEKGRSYSGNFKNSVITFLVFFFNFLGRHLSHKRMGPGMILNIAAHIKGPADYLFIFFCNFTANNKKGSRNLVFFKNIQHVAHCIITGCIIRTIVKT